MVGAEGGTYLVHGGVFCGNMSQIMSGQSGLYDFTVLAVGCTF